MTQFLMRRLMQMAITIFIVSIIVFFLVRLGGDPIRLLAPPDFTPAQIETLRRAWGLDGNVIEQYVAFVRRAATGDFGRSIRFQRPAMDLVLERLPMTVLLAALAASVSLIVAIPLGILSALRRNSAADLFITALATLGVAMPNFWIGLMLIMLFSVHLRMLPAFGAGSAAAFIMPVATLAFDMVARTSRLMRSTMLEVLGQDYIRTARGKGLHPMSVVRVHALPNAIIPVITIFGLQVGWLLGGSVVVEQVFSWPGLGRLMFESVTLRDMPVIQAGILLVAVTFSVINLLVDIIYTLVDPRIQYA